MPRFVQIETLFFGIIHCIKFKIFFVSLEEKPEYVTFALFFIMFGLAVIGKNFFNGLQFLVIGVRTSHGNNTYILFPVNLSFKVLFSAFLEPMIWFRITY